MPKQISDARKKLLKNGKVMLLKDGYFGLSVSKLAHKCKMATGTFYSYFSSKAELAEVIVQTDREIMLRKMDAIINMQEPIDKPTYLDQQVSFNKKLAGIYLELKKFSDLYLTVWTQFGAEKNNMQRFDVIKAVCIQQINARVKQILLEIATPDSEISLQMDADNLSLIIIHNLFMIARTPIFNFENFVDVLWKWAFIPKK